MKIICTTNHLRAAVLHVERFTSRHITLPILSHIFLYVREKKFSLIATNLEVGIEYLIPGKIQKPGAATAPAKLLSQLLQSIPDETITLEGEQGKLTLRTPNTTATLIGLDPKDFPNLPIIKSEQTFAVAASLLRGALSQVVPAMATNNLKPELSGVFCETSAGAITLAATDSFRLGEKTLTNLDGVKSSGLCIIPARTVQELLRTMPEEGEVRVSVGENQIVFEWEGARILSSLIDGTFPPYKNLIPKAYETTTVVNRNDLVKKIRLAAVFSTRLNDVSLQVTPSAIAISTTNAETGATTTELPAKGRGAAGTVVFNYRYLLDGVEAAGGELTVLNLNGASGPALIQGHGDSSYSYLVMPIRST